MAWMSDEKYTYIQDCKEKKSIGASAFKARTHCGKGGRVKLPSDYLSKKELKAMNGECKSYRLNAPMSWEEFKSMPDDLKIVYIKGLREKYNVPDTKLIEIWDVTPYTFRKWIKCLGLQQGKGAGAAGRHWYNTDDCVNFNAWWFGVKLDAKDESEDIVETPAVEPVVTVEEANVETPEVREEVVEAALFAIREAAVAVQEDMDNKTQVANDPDKTFTKYAERVDQYCGYDAGPIAFTGHHMPVIPKSGSMTFENNRANDALDTIKCLLSDVRVNLTISWECVFEGDVGEQRI